MGRYSNTNQGQLKKGGLTYKTTIYQVTPERNDDIRLISRHGDRFDLLAYKYYKNQHLWWYLARVNNLKTMNIPAGTKLRIPISLESAR